MDTADLLAITADDLAIARLGERTIDTPLRDLLGGREESVHYVTETDRVLLDDTLGVAKRRSAGTPAELPAFNPGGPREKLYFEPSTVTAAIVTCGGLCPGLNNVVRALVLQLANAYGVKSILGFRNGYSGLTDTSAPLALTPELVRDIHNRGGTILGTSRGGQEPAAMVDTLARHRVDMLFVIGGDGSLRGAQKIAAKPPPATAARRGGHPEDHRQRHSVDRPELRLPDRVRPRRRVDPRRAHRGRVHRRRRGTGQADGPAQRLHRLLCDTRQPRSRLRPDPRSLLPARQLPALPAQARRSAGARSRGRRRGRRAGAVPRSAETDASGNARLGDIGALLRERVTAHFAQHGTPLSLRYVDPGYAIRSVPANAFDAVYCARLAQAAVHAGMAGFTSMVVARWHGRFIHLPIALATATRNQVDPHGDLWMSVLEATGQPKHL